MQFFNIIDGQKRSGEETHRGTNPRTEQPLWEVPVASLQDLDDAVAAAQRAIKTWSKTTVPERQALLTKLCERLQTHKQELMDILMQESGKSVCIYNATVDTFPRDTDQINTESAS